MFIKTNHFQNILRFIVLVLWFQVSANNTLYTIKIDSISNEKQAKLIQKRTSEIFNSLVDVTVRLNFDGFVATGVIVSQDGYVLTAHHVIKDIDETTVAQLKDGSKYTITILGSDVGSDYGLIKIEPKYDLPYAKMGNVAELDMDEACLMFGHSKSVDENRLPIGRLGFYKGINIKDFFKASCVMMPGDSGGPIFNLDGELIGICCFIGPGLDDNYYASIDNVKKNFDRLKKGEIFNNQGNLNEKYSSDLSIPKAKNRSFVLEGGKPALLSIISNKIGDQYKSVVKIKSDKNEAVVSYGTIFNSNGYVVSKSSEILTENVYCVLHNGETLKAKVLSRNKRNDLVVLKIESNKALHPITMDNLNKAKGGAFLGTLGSDKNNLKRVGVLGLETTQIEDEAIGFLGISFKYVNDKVEVYGVAKNGPGLKAGIVPGDYIVKFNDSVIASTKDLFKVMETTKPDQKVSIRVLRNGQIKELQVIMGHRPLKKPLKDAPGYIETSNRNDGFPNVFVHDMPLKVSECGTPVINFEGDVIGLNIARKNRASSLAIPINSLSKILKEMVGL